MMCGIITTRYWRVKMAGKNNTVVKVAWKPLPSAKKIAKRGLYEVMWGVKPRNYGKRVGL